MYADPPAPPPPTPHWWEPRTIKGPHLTVVLVGKSIIALHDVPAYMASTYLVSAFLAHSTSFSPNVFNPLWWNVY